MKQIDRFIITTSIVTIAAYLTEFIAIFVAGAYYPGYNQLHGTMSSLGAYPSPLGNVISYWWMLMGVIVTIFGIAFKSTLENRGWYAKLASWLIIAYGLGEGIGSGAFKAGHRPTGITDSAFMHDFLGGIGVVAILVLPLILPKVIFDDDWRYFKRISKIVFTLGIGFILLFLLRFLPNKTNFISENEGLWQRLYMLNTYIYLTIIALIVMKISKSKRGNIAS